MTKVHLYLNKSKPENAISDMCKTIRRERHITQALLAKSIGIHQTEISYIERGFLPDVDTLVKIVDLYKDTQVYQKQTLI